MRNPGSLRISFSLLVFGIAMHHLQYPYFDDISWYLWNILGFTEPIIGPNISAEPHTSVSSSSSSSSDIVKRSPAGSASAGSVVEPRFDDFSLNNSLVVANIGESVALHCRIWMKQVCIMTQLSKLL